MRGRMQSVAWLMRRAGLDANPIRRGSDRAEAWIRISFVAVFLIAGPLTAVALGHWADDSAVSAASAQAAAEYRVRAVLLRSAPAARTYQAYRHSRFAWVRAQWTGPDGTSHTGDVPAAPGARSGSAVTIWTDTFGALASPPIGHAQILGRVVAFAAVVPAALAIVLPSVLWATRRVLDRRRLAAWERDWAAVEPRWNRRLR